MPTMKKYILPFILLFVYPEIQTRFMQAELSPEV